MGCDIKVLVNNYVDGKLQTQEQTLLKNTDENIDINRAVELLNCLKLNVLNQLLFLGQLEYKL